MGLFTAVFSQLNTLAMASYLDGNHLGVTHSYLASFPGSYTHESLGTRLTLTVL